VSMTVDSEIKKLIRSEVVDHLKALREAQGKLWLSLEDLKDSLSGLRTDLVGDGPRSSSADGGTPTPSPGAPSPPAGNTPGRSEGPSSSASEGSRPEDYRD